MVIVDENTGSTMADRFWDTISIDGRIQGGPFALHFAQSLASISFQRFFGGIACYRAMSGTVAEAASELGSVYRLPITAIRGGGRCSASAGDEDLCGSHQPLESCGWSGRRPGGRGQPVLVGVTSVKEAVRASEALGARGIAHRVLSAAQDREEAEAIAAAGERGAVTVPPTWLAAARISASAPALPRLAVSWS